MKSPPVGTPLILAIHGAPGTGKSFQLDKVLIETGTYYRTINSSDLESDRANDPARLLQKTYLELADEVSAKGLYSGALVINDIDSALGDWGALVQTTVNRQLVIGELQHITDYPTHVTNRQNLRIPIFITANDLTKLYGPLLRPGRTATFFWEPDSSELAEILHPLVPNLKPNELKKFIASIGGTSVTRYVDAIRVAVETQLAPLVGDFQANILRARRGDLDNILLPSLPELIAATESLRQEEEARLDYSKDAE